jgi:hypothetical protein
VKRDAYFFIRHLREHDSGALADGIIRDHVDGLDDPVSILDPARLRRDRDPLCDLIYLKRDLYIRGLAATD